MKKLKKLVVGNWKMNPLTIEEAREIARKSKNISKTVKKTQIVLCPPLIYIPSLSSIPKGNIFLGAQDAFFETTGSFTGEVGASQLYQFGVRYIIAGHSERRKAGETSETINKKVRSIVGEGMTAILCVGEVTRDHHGEYLNTVKKQIIEGLRDVGKKSLERIIIAYEPVWAVGGSVAMPPRDIHEMSIFIKKVLRDFAGVLSDGVRILYGGDVTAGNCVEIMKDGFVHGLLIGRASLRAKDFTEIIKLVDSI